MVINMWKCLKSIYEYHILICPDLYISRDDILSINNEIYEITGITEEYDIYLQDKNKKLHIYTPKDFVKLLQDNEFKYIRNFHEECLDRNRKLSYNFNNSDI